MQNTNNMEVNDKQSYRDLIYTKRKVEKQIEEYTKNAFVRYLAPIDDALNRWKEKLSQIVNNHNDNYVLRIYPKENASKRGIDRSKFVMTKHQSDRWSYEAYTSNSDYTDPLIFRSKDLQSLLPDEQDLMIIDQWAVKYKISCKESQTKRIKNIVIESKNLKNLITKRHLISQGHQVQFTLDNFSDYNKEIEKTGEMNVNKSDDINYRFDSPLEQIKRRKFDAQQQWYKLDEKFIEYIANMDDIIEELEVSR